MGVKSDFLSWGEEYNLQVFGHKIGKVF